MRMAGNELEWTVRKGDYAATADSPAKALSELYAILPISPIIVLPEPEKKTTRKRGTTMARVVEYAVKSDLSGKEIPKGKRVIVRFEFEDEGTPNFVADLNTDEGKAMVEHCHARAVTPRVRKSTEEATPEAA